MALFDWNNSYKVGVDIIDEQHQVLVNYLNELFEAMKVGKGFDVMEKILNGLVDYTVMHFGTEEELMDETGYPSIKDHLHAHRSLVKNVRQFQDDFKSRKKTLSMDVLNFLKDWLKNHILITDKKLGKYIKETKS